MRTPGPVHAALTALLVATLALTISGCAGNKPSAGRCESVSTPLTDIPTRTDQEPKMRIPVPPGWERSTEIETEQFRFSIRNKSLAADGFTPNAVVSLQKVAGDLGKPEQILQAQQEQLAKKLDIKDVKSESTSVCGAPALSSTYTTPELKLGKAGGKEIPTIPERRATTLGTVYRAGDSNYVATLTVQTIKPDNPTYMKDSGEILKGFQLLPPQ